MVLKKTFFSLIAIFIAHVFGAVGLWAGDVASFIDLGFSEQGRIYSFGQYGVEEKTLRPWANFYVIDVPSNDFVPGGRLSYTHDEKINVGQDGAGALMSLISKNVSVTQKYRTNFMQQGIPLFISLKDVHSPKGDSVNFRDFDYHSYYDAELNSISHGAGRNVRSSFFIVLKRVTDKGVQTVYRVGSPDVNRAGVTSYSIKKVIVNPERTSMIFVIEMTLYSESGPDIRYMVEAVRF